jgi:hypothetical protein
MGDRNGRPRDIDESYKLKIINDLGSKNARDVAGFPCRIVRPDDN